jgi:hypothetical protein
MSDHLSILYSNDNYLSGRINELSSYSIAVSGTVKSNSANWNNVSNKLDTTAFSTVSGTFLTSHQTIPSAKWEDASDKVRANSAQWAKNDGNTAVNNWVQQNSGTCNSTNTTVGLNSEFWSNTCFVVLDNSASWGQGGNPFPLTSQVGNTRYTLNASSDALWVSTAAERAGASTKFDVRGVRYDAYPSTDVSASWYNIITNANAHPNTYCVQFSNTMTAIDLANYSAYDKVTVVHSMDYTPNCHLYWKSYTKVIPSGLWCELVKGKNEQSNTEWYFINSGWMNNYEWDWD